MTITQGEYQSYDYDRMIVRFTLMDGDVVVPCSVSTTAMDQLDNGARANDRQREAQFMRLRERIEAQAIAKIRRLEFDGRSREIVLRTVDFRAGS